MPLDQATSQDKRGTTWLQTIAVPICIGLLMTLVGVSFWQHDFIISNSTLVLVAFLVVLCLSETFDQFNVLKLLTVSRRVQELNIDNEGLKKSNGELQDRLLTLYQLTSANSQSRASSATQVVFNNGTPVVEAASADEIEQKAQDQVAVPDAVAASGALSNANPEETTTAQPPGEALPPPVSNQNTKDREYATRRRLLPKIERWALNRFAEQRQLPLSSISRDIKISGGPGELFAGADPIMERPMIFDGYVKQPTGETFIEIQTDMHTSPLRLDQLYVRITKILFYRQARNVDAELALVLVKLPPGVQTSSIGFARRPALDYILQYFQPAIRNRLLKIETLELTDTDIEAIEASDIA